VGLDGEKGWGIVLEKGVGLYARRTMSLTKLNADRCLHLLWECRSRTEAAGQRQAYEQAISSLHAYLTDVLPATLPCVRANAEHGIIELFQDEARAQEVHFLLEEGDKLGIVLDKINVNTGVNTASPIAIALIKPSSVAAKDNRLARGDQVLCINSHFLSQVSLQRARYAFIACFVLDNCSQLCSGGCWIVLSVHAKCISPSYPLDSLMV
jgi:hypothetical protein